MKNQTNYQDVDAFHEHFGLPRPASPRLLTRDLYDFRRKFLAEELREFEASHEAGNLAEAADALIDLVYVAMGTAVMMGLPWEKLWDDVQRANMSKVRVQSAAESKRGSAIDVIKPPGWQPPQGEKIINDHLFTCEVYNCDCPPQQCKRPGYRP